MTVQDNKLTIVFDIGGVLIDWDPRHLYRKLFDGDEEAMDQFLSQICSPEWNAQMDRGKPFSEAVAELVSEYPAYRPFIVAYQTRWEEMIAGAIEPTVSILAELNKAGYPLYALSNWSAETFPLMRGRFKFLNWFQDIMLSGEVGLAKPDPAIFRLFRQRTGLTAENCFYIDDSYDNITAAAQSGFRTLYYQSSRQLCSSLIAHGFPLGCQ